MTLVRSIPATALSVMMAASANTGLASDCDELTLAQVLSHAIPDVSDTQQEVRQKLALASAKAESELFQQPSSTSLTGSDISRNLLNFLPLFSASGLSGGLDGGNDSSSNDQLGFDFNIPLPGGSENGRELKLAASFNRQPRAYEPLVDSVDENARAQLRSELEADFNLSDDATFSVFYNVSNKHFGRYRGMLGDLFADVMVQVDPAAYQAAFAAYSRLLRQVSRATRSPATKIADLVFVDAGGQVLRSDNPAADPQAEKRQEFCDAYLTMRDASQTLDVLEELALSNYSIDSVSMLANNQPQLHFGLSFRDRVGAAGPNETSLSVTFEWGYRANLSILRKTLKQAGARCVNAQLSACRLNAFSDYIGANRQAINAIDRLVFALEYVDTDSYRFESAAPEIAFRQDGSRKIVASLGYGRALETPGGGRLDLTVRYDDVDNDAVLNDRAVGILTVTKSFGAISLPFSLVYANKPEFVMMNADDRLSAHLGVKYEMPGGF